MIVKDEFLNKLRRTFNLNLYEVKIWTALLSRGVSTAGELSDIANVPRSRSYDVLESLERKGFIVMKVGKPIKYIAVPPAEVLDRVKKNVAVEAKEQTERLDQLKGTDIITELNSLHSQGVELIEPSDLSGSIRGRTNLYNHLEMMIKNAEKSVVIVTTEDGLIRKMDLLKNAMKKAKDRGVKIRIAAPMTKDTSQILKDISGIAELKQIDKIKGRFVVVDSKDVTFMLLDDKKVHFSYDVGIWVNTPFFASALQDMFDHVWKDLKPATR